MSKLFYVAASFLLTAIAVTMFVGMREASPAFGGTPTLDGFDIQTGENQVIVTLYTDERASFKTETTDTGNGKQFAIILPEAQLSAEQLNNGLPVVVDNQNKFIGRAVPTGDGQVKIILPNIPVETYAVSVRQQPAGKQANPAPMAPDASLIANGPAEPPLSMAGIAEPATSQAAPLMAAPSVSERPAIEPRPAVRRLDSRFELLASDFGPPSSDGPAIERVSSAQPAARRSQTVSRQPAQGATVENPYVSSLLRKPPRPHYLREQGDQAVTTLSMADNPPAVSLDTYPMASGGKDPLWYLHSLPPFDPAQGLSSVGLATAAQQDQAALAGLTPSPTQAVQPAGTTVVAYQNPLDGAVDALKQLPKWLMVMIALFLGGIGLFAAVGSLLAARQLWLALRAKPEPQASFLYTGLTPAISAAALAQQYGLAAPMAVNEAPPQPPEDVTRFADTPSVNAMDYLQHSPTNVQQAVQNANLLKFPSQRKSRTGMTRRLGNQ